MLLNSRSRPIQLLTVLATMAGLITSAQANVHNRPYRYNNVANNMQVTLVDFSVTATSGNHGGFSTFNSPYNSGVKYVDLGHYGGGVGRCFQYSFATVAGGPQTDLIAWAKEGSGWTRVSDDMEGYFPVFRVWVGPNWSDNPSDAIRLSAYSASSNAGNFFVKMVELNSNQTSCESTGAVVRLDNGVTVVRSN